jgi:dihydroorotate dehydrogenase (NAD+) catalytic subunit
VSERELCTTIAGIELRSPMLLAAGTAGVLGEMRDVLDVSRLGAIVTKSITRDVRAGNAFPRITFARAGMMNAIGLANPGVDAFERDEGPRVKSMGCAVIGSVAGDRIEDYLEVATRLSAIEGMAGIEANVSCPNVHSGLEFGSDPAALRELICALAPAVGDLPLFVKLSPVTVGTPHTIVDLARVAIESGAKGLTLTNTVPAMGIDVRTRRPILANVTGGLSGPAIHPIVVRLVHLVYRGVANDAGVPIVAAGGVSRWEDAAEFVLAGASAVQIGAGSFASPRASVRMRRGLARWVRSQGVSTIGELVGRVELGT